MNIFVAKISSSTTEEDLQALFEEHGAVDTARVIMDRETGNSKCFAFVEMPDDAEAMNAINALNESEFKGRNIVVKQANPREDRGNRGGFRGGRRNFNREGGERRHRNY